MAKEQATNTTGANAVRPGGQIQPGEVIPFIRRKDYEFVRELGQGACGKTVLLRDPLIDQLYVCKKYHPFSEDERTDLFHKFVQEVKLLYLLNHRNIVRIHHHFLFPDSCTGYILMEYVNGATLDEYLKQHPEHIANAFEQAIGAFAHLNRVSILHRDIRPSNLMVTTDGTVKVIDFGFGKSVRTSHDFEKSVSLNWVAPPPKEFGQHRYDFSTEVYFVGTIFLKALPEQNRAGFKHARVLERMCQADPEKRYKTFAAVEADLAKVDDADEFSNAQREIYASFAQCLSGALQKIERAGKYRRDTDVVMQLLANACEKCSLEAFVPDSLTVIDCFIEGQYYRKVMGFDANVLRAFTKLMQSLSPEKRRVVLLNLHGRLDVLPRYDDDIPF